MALAVFSDCDAELSYYGIKSAPFTFLTWLGVDSERLWWLSERVCDPALKFEDEPVNVFGWLFAACGLVMIWRDWSRGKPAFARFVILGMMALVARPWLTQAYPASRIPADWWGFLSFVFIESYAWLVIVLP